MFSIDKIELAKVKKSVLNKMYYEENKHQNHRASLLCAVQHKGRVPKLASIEKYNITIEELVPKWRAYCKSHDDIRPLKILKFQTLVMNMI